ncbi:hypothetical protein Pyn_09137 [Prunus yedoensis var. nudiflora]|uniref:Uncharacterized protein n=1 Tax=Prunus yedoensis var. nudiflora TaxID=2094558 RepID=A0A314ZAE1_PRUYE|nr:hypothetical protein Pyn_09137 [Prunus yedoensis var. nudiflora]
MTTKEKAWRPVDWRWLFNSRREKIAHKTFFALPSQNMLAWENRESKPSGGSSKGYTAPKQDELVERYPGLLGLFAALNLLMMLPLKGKTLMIFSNFCILFVGVFLRMQLMQPF